MDSFVVAGGRPLSGEMTVAANENAALPLLRRESIAGALLPEVGRCPPVRRTLTDGFCKISRNAGALFFLLASACIVPRDGRIDIDSGGGASPTDAGIGGDQSTVPLRDGTSSETERGPGTEGGVDAADGPGADAAPSPQSYYLTVTVQGPGQVVGDEAFPFRCSSTCTRQLGARAVVTLVATPDRGALIEWQGACVGTGSCRVTLTSDTSVTAVFRPFVTWKQAAGFPTSLAVTGDQIYVTGSLLMGPQDFGGISATGTNLSDGFLAKYDAIGKLQWLKTFGNPGASYGANVAASPTGDVFLAGYGAQGSVLDGMPLAPMFVQSPFIAWFSQAGQLQKLLTDSPIGPAVFDPSGNLVLATYANLVKFGADRQMLWSQSGWTVGGVRPTSLALDQAGNIFLCAGLVASATLAGTTYTPVGATDALLIKHTSAGAIQWVATFGSVGDDSCETVAVDRLGDAYMVGESGGDFLLGGRTYTNAGETDAFVAKVIGSSGAFAWVSVLGSTSPDGASTILPDTNGGVLVAAAGSFDLMPGRPFAGSSLLWLSPATGTVTSANPIGLQIRSLARHSSGDFVFVGWEGLGRLWLP